MGVLNEKRCKRDACSQRRQRMGFDRKHENRRLSLVSQRSNRSESIERVLPETS